MNLQLAVVGAPKTGKTSLCINFAEYLGATNLAIRKTACWAAAGVISVRQARKLMVHPGSRSNGVMRSFAVNLPGYSLRRVVLVDTVFVEQKPSRRERPAAFNAAGTAGVRMPYYTSLIYPAVILFCFILPWKDPPH